MKKKALQLFKDCERLVRQGEGSGQREAYVMFTDLLIVFGRQLKKHSHLSSLLYIPDPALQQALQVSKKNTAILTSLSLSLSLSLSAGLCAGSGDQQRRG